MSADWLKLGVAEFSARPDAASGGGTQLGDKKPVIPVIKFGGSLLQDELLQRDIVRQLIILSQLGIVPIVVHGGGMRIGTALKNSKIDSHFVRGLRVTPPEAIRVIADTLDEINADLVSLTLALAQEQNCGLKATGCLAANSPLTAVPLDKKIWGHVGKIVDVRQDELKQLAADRILFLSCMARSIPTQPASPDNNDDIYNINADMAASAVACSVSADSLIYLTDQAGILDAEGNVLAELSAASIKQLQENNTIKEGMLPKTEAMLEAMAKGVTDVRVIPGAEKNCILRCLCSDAKTGTIGTRLV